MNALTATFPADHPLSAARRQPGIPALLRAFSDRFAFARAIGIGPDTAAQTARTSAARYLPTSDPRDPIHTVGARSVIVLTASARDRAGRTAIATAVIYFGPGGVIRPAPQISGTDNRAVRVRLGFALRGLASVAVARTADGRPTGGLTLSPDNPADGIEIVGAYTGFSL